MQKYHMKKGILFALTAFLRGSFLLLPPFKAAE